MEVTTDMIRVLRERTNAGIMDCKKALEVSDGDLKKAEMELLAKGVAKASSKSDRTTGEGVIGSYIHAGNRVGALVELNCETDFVARTKEFSELAHNIAMQIAAMSPVYLDEDQMPEDDKRAPEDACLLRQAFIKDPSKTINDLVVELRSQVGENIRVRRMIRFGLGE